MLIKIKDNIIWNTESIVQSEETIDWFKKEVYPLLETVEPVYDIFNRPEKWTVNIDGVTVTQIREYIYDSSSWAMKGDRIIVLKK